MNDGQEGTGGRSAGSGFGSSRLAASHPHVSLVVLAADVARARALLTGEGIRLEPDTPPATIDRTSMHGTGHAIAVRPGPSSFYEWHPATGRVVRDTAFDPLFGSDTGQSGMGLAGWLDRIHPHDRPAVEQAQAQMMRTGGGYTIEYRVATPGGRFVTVSEHAQMMHDSAEAHDGDGLAAVRILGCICDMTGQRHSEAELRSIAIRAQAMFDNAAVGIAEVAPDGTWLSANARMAEITGYEPQELVARTFQDITHPDDIEGDLLHVERMIAGEIDTYSIEKRYVRKDGSVVWVELTVGSVRRDDGVLDYFVSVVEDISARKNAEERLRESEALLRLILDSTLAFVGVLDVDGTLREANRPALHSAGIDRSDVVGRKFWDCPWWSHDPVEMDRLRQAVARCASGEVIRYDAVVRMAGDSRMHIDFMLSPVLDEQGRARLLVPSAFDITERKQQEEHVHLLMREVNHRSKNMLTVIQAVARRTAASDPATFVERFSQRLQALASSQDLLIEGNWASVPLADLIQAQLAHFVEPGNPRIRLDGPMVRVTASASQALGMALHELATNAVKYGALSTAEGQVSIGWRIHDDNEGRRRFAMQWVERGGPPVIAPTRTGFGSTVIDRMVSAAISCKAVIDYAPGGLVWHIDCPVDTVLEGGSGQYAPDRQEQTGIARAGDRATILVLEDEPLVAMEIADVLEAAGHAVLGPVSTCRAALDLLAGQGCAAAVLDVNLTGETSEEVAAALRAAKTPFVILSGYSRDQLPATLADAVLLAKPLRSGALVAALARCLAAE